MAGKTRVFFIQKTKRGKKKKKSEKEKGDKKTCEEKSGGIRALAHTVKLSFALSCLHLVWHVQGISHKWL